MIRPKIKIIIVDESEKPTALLHRTMTHNRSL